MQNSGLTLQPPAVMADFKLALLQAVELQFPSNRIMGCYFHFSQCLWRKVQALGLATAYSPDATVKCFIHKTAALSFVPVPFLRVAWSAIKANSTEVQMIQVAAGEQPRPKKRKAVRQDEQIKRLVAEFSSGKRTMESLLSALANMVVDFS